MDDREMAKQLGELAGGRSVALSRRGFLRATGALGVALGVPAVLASCSSASRSGSSSTAKREIGFDFPFTTIAVYGNLKKFAEERAQQRGYTMRYTNDNSDLSRQVAGVSAWVAQSLPAMVVFPLEPATMESIGKQARDKGLTFVSYSVQMKNADGAVLFSGIDSGKVLGQNASGWINKNLAGKAKVLLLGNNSLDVGVQRDKGLASVFPAAAPGAQIISTQQATTRAEGLSITSQILAAHPDLNVVLGYDDDVALGAYQAFLQHGVAANDPKVYIGSQDGTQESMQTIAKGGIYRCTAAVRIRDIGHAIVDIPADLLEKKAKSPAVINVPPVAITVDSPLLAAYLGDYGVKL